MKRTIYIRVSTEKQTYDRQLYKMKEYFTAHGMNMKDVEIISEKITSHTRFAQRAIYPVLRTAQRGDIIYACQLDRFGRTTIDILELVSFAVDRGVVLITIDNGYQLENKTPMGKMYLGMLAAMAEAERELRAERCQAGTEAVKENIRLHGHHVARSSGRIITHLGNERGVDTSKASAASALRHEQDAILWRQSSTAFKYVEDLLAAGMSRKEIIERFNARHDESEENAKVFCTRNGKKLSAGVLSRWIAQMNPLV